MFEFIIFFIIIGSMVFFYRVFEILEKNQQVFSAYAKRKYLMTKAELEFFRVLESVVKNQYYIIPQVSISKIAMTVARGKDYYMYSNKIDRKTVDFVLFDKQYFSPIMVIELDDISHDNERRKTRDNFVDNVMENIGLKTVHVRTAYKYNVEELSNLVFGIKDNNTKEQDNEINNQQS